jgi:hypothetical protein
VSEEYLSFEKVLRELQIEEDELKKLVSAGEIRAFRDADKMKFKREEIDKLKQDRDSSPDVIEILDSDSETSDESTPTLEEDSSELTEELSFDDDLDSDVGMATAEISEDDFLSDSDLGTEVEDVDLGVTSIEEEDLEEPGPAVTSTPRDRARIKKTRIPGKVEEEEEAEPPWAVGVMGLSVLVLIMGVLIMVDVATSSPSPLVAWLVNIFAS